MATTNQAPSAWTGWVFFAGFMMILSGFFQSIAGLTSLLKPTWYATTANHLLIFNYTAWGWFDLIVGVIVLLAGFSLLHGSGWARFVAVVMAIISALGALASISAYPIWSVLIIVVSILVIHAVTVHGNELNDE